MARRDGDWSVLTYGLGDVDTLMTLNISGNSPSSSLLELNAQAVAAYPALAYCGKEQVTIRKLDTVFADVAGSHKNVFLKIDTQGFERQVLEGGVDSLSRIVGVQIETSLVPVYHGEFLIESMIEYLRMRGFDPFWITHGYRNQRTLQLYQVDVIFFRRLA